VYSSSATHFLGRPLLGGSVNRANLLFIPGKIRTVIIVPGNTGSKFSRTDHRLLRNKAPG
jgi:hypothetical protein